VSSALIMRIRQIKEIEVEGLGPRIQQARSAIAGVRSLDQICEEVGVSRTYWYDLESERIKGTLSIENLRKIEQALGADFGVKFDD
jgi:transcriptional regulator with XRE-family HTH domain